MATGVSSAFKAGQSGMLNSVLDIFEPAP